MLISMGLNLMYNSLCFFTSFSGCPFFCYCTFIHPLFVVIWFVVLKVTITYFCWDILPWSTFELFVSLCDDNIFSLKNQIIDELIRSTPFDILTWWKKYLRQKEKHGIKIPSEGKNNLFKISSALYGMPLPTLYVLQIHCWL